MLKPRVIPCLLLRGRGLYKTVKFSVPKYIGDPVNAVKIFNEKEVDELLLLDITATLERREPNFELVEDIAGECFMPLTYGGGVTSIEQIRKLHRVGVEKVSLNSAAFHNSRLVEESCATFGSSSIVVAIDVKKTLFGSYEVWINSGKINTKKDPVNAVKIFNEKEVDELLLLDITATLERREPNFELVEDIAGECFMPLTYGGGVTSIEQIRKLHRVGVEKVSLNSAAFHNSRLVEESCATFGSSSIVVAIDVKKTLFGSYEVWINSGKINTKKDPVSYAAQLAKLGVGEILVNSIDRDGTMGGFDLNLLKKISSSVETPIIACGGAGILDHVREAIGKAGVNAVAAGSMFVFHGKHKAVLINYPSPAQLEELQLNNPAP